VLTKLVILKLANSVAPNTLAKMILKNNTHLSAKAFLKLYLTNLKP